jgi:phospholipid/cholesterol/gamma-HCH transport system substrate-binding protein
MQLTRRILAQLAVFTVIALVALTIMTVRYMRLPVLLFNIGHYNVSVELPRGAGLYKSANVTYRGTQIGRVTDLHLTDSGVTAVLSLDSNYKIPSDVDAEVHSVSAIGEQYVSLLPRNGSSAPLKDGDVIPVSRAKVPPDINALLDATDRGLRAIPKDDLKTAIDESYTAVGGLGPELSRLIKGSTQLAIDAHTNLDSLTTLIDASQPVLDSQSETSGAIQAWASHLADITGQLKANDDGLTRVLVNRGPANPEAIQLAARLKVSLPVLLTNLVSINQVAISYQPALEQMLVLLPELTADMQAGALADKDVKSPYRGQFLDFNLNFNVPAPCTTGFLPAQQQRPPTFEDTPERPAGDLYCRVPQDSPLAVRGARNYPCMTVPGKRAPTVKMCESNEQYVPLNDGWNWKGDPNATLSGQGIPQLPPGSPPAAPPPPVAVAQYDPATGTYVGPDGHVYTQTDLGQSPPGDKSWQNMVIPNGGN